MAALWVDMPFKTHPHFDNSKAADWLPFPNEENRREFDRGLPALLIETLRGDKQRICGLALERIKRHTEADYLAARRYPEINEILFFPIGERGFRVYVEYFFLERPDENSGDSDFWWVIINCPYAVPPFPTGKREYYVIGLGWFIA